jgi:hypothetical protein
VASRTPRSVLNLLIASLAASLQSRRGVPAVFSGVPGARLLRVFLVSPFVSPPFFLVRILALSAQMFPGIFLSGSHEILAAFSFIHVPY